MTSQAEQFIDGNKREQNSGRRGKWRKEEE